MLFKLQINLVGGKIAHRQSLKRETKRVKFESFD